MGGNAVPCLFLCLLLLIFVVLILIYGLTHRFITNLGKGQVNISKIFGSVGVFVAWASTIFTLKDLIKYFLMMFGIKLDL